MISLRLVWDANLGGPNDVNAAKAILAGFNEDGCPINNAGEPTPIELLQHKLHWMVLWMQEMNVCQ